jgi:hypothetical protein
VSSEPVIAGAHVVAGHDGEAQLEVRVRYENGALGTVTLDAACAQRLLEECAAEKPDDLRGQPWQRLLDVLP